LPVPPESSVSLDDLRIKSSLPDTESAMGGGKSRLGRMFSPLTLRVLAVNLTAPVLLVLSLLFLDQYEDTLIATELEALRTQGELIAASIGEGAVVVDIDNNAFPIFTANGALRVIDPNAARQLLRRLAGLAEVRARLFDRNGQMVVDTRLLQGPGGEVQVLDLPPPGGTGFADLLRQAYDQTIGRFAYDRDLEPYLERPSAPASDYTEVVRTMELGEAHSAVRLRSDRQKILTVAVPILFYKQIVGTVLVSRDGSNVDERMFSVRSSILGIFGWIFALTVLTSLFLARTIARPVRKLAEAAQRVHQSKSRRYTIPNLSRRSDEIGELSTALRDMTDSLWTRMDAIENFAADVAHEIKNPLTSLRSAVETVARVADPEQQKRLMSIILDDVARLDRLITEISDASRLDAELSRAEMTHVGIGHLVKALAEIQNANDDPKAPKVEVIAEDPDSRGRRRDPDLTVPGLEGRLGQVFRNLIGNAVSFSPISGVITVRTTHTGRYVKVIVEDQGPGIPAGKENAIFSRFYSERPEGEKFGTHSGLGLAISKQIIEAHHGTVFAENILDDEKVVIGARFVVRLPAA
jgi:two-component system, OmpR family, sensor histidine kinase ChvG